MKKTLFTLIALAGAVCAEPELIYHLDFEAPDGSNHNGAMLTDSSNANSGITSSATGGYMNYVTGYLESSRAYHNSQNYIKLELNGALTYTSDFTVTMVTKLASTPSGENKWRNILMLGDNKNHVRIQNTDNYTPVGLYGNGTLSADADKLNTDNTPYTLNTTDWTRLTLTYTYNEGEGGFFRLYADSTLVSESRIAFNVDGNATAPAVLSLGGSPAGGSLNQLHIDEFGIYNAALTQEQIANHLVGKATTAFPAAATLTETSVTSVKVLVNGADVSLTLNVAANLDGITGGFNTIVGDDAWDSIVAGMGDTSMDSAATVTLVGADGTSLVLGTGTNVTLNGYAGEADGKYVVKFIPEPATATLSLLALAGLAARRRRK